MNIEIDHLGIAVRSLKADLAFYETLGLAADSKETVETERVHVAMLPTGSTASGPRIELLEAVDAESPIAKFVQSRGPGLHHIALRVENLSAVVERLKAQGCRILNEPRRGAGGHEYVFVHPHSTGGVLLELIQQ